MSEQPQIVIDKVSHLYCPPSGRPVLALEEVTLDIREREFLALMADRRVEETLSREVLDGGCLLCSENTPEHCHRRLVAEYLKRNANGKAKNKQTYRCFRGFQAEPASRRGRPAKAGRYRRCQRRR